MSEGTERVLDSDEIPTKELLKRQRKEDYVAAKVQRKSERVQAKQLAAEEKRQARSDKDRALWELLQPAAEFSPEAE